MPKASNEACATCGALQYSDNAPRSCQACGLVTKTFKEAYHHQHSQSPKDGGGNYTSGAQLHFMFLVAD